LDMFDLGEGWRYLEICGNSLLFASMPALLSCLSFYFSRIETAGFLSTWIGLQLVAIQRARMGEILKNLLPLDMVDLVLSLHFQQGHESLPVTVFRERRAIVLHLDLKNYTGLTRSLLVRELAQHIDNIFRQFDTLVTDSGAKRLGLFKIDTIGDAYEAAAWLSDSYDGTCTTREEYEALQQRDVDVCRCMNAVGWAMVEEVRKYSNSKGINIECRVGISSGQVLAGMLGKLSPRFHLMGEAVWAAHKLEASAAVNAVQVGEHVQLMLDFMG